MTTRVALARTRRSRIAFAAFALLGASLWAQSQPVQTFSGTLMVIWGDPHPDFNVGGEIRYALAMDDGQVVPVQVPGPQDAAVSYFNRRVVVSGRLATLPSPVTDSPSVDSIVADTIALDSAAPPELTLPAAALGTKKVIYLLVRFSGDSVPHPPSFYLNINNPDTPPAGEVCRRN